MIRRTIISEFQNFLEETYHGYTGQQIVDTVLSERQKYVFLNTLNGSMFKTIATDLDISPTRVRDVFAKTVRILSRVKLYGLSTAFTPQTNGEILKDKSIKLIEDLITLNKYDENLLSVIKNIMISSKPERFEQEKIMVLPDMNIDDVTEISASIRYRLRQRLDINVVKDLTNYSYSDLINNINGLGERAANKIKDMLELIDLSLSETSGIETLEKRRQDAKNKEYERRVNEIRNKEAIEKARKESEDKEKQEYIRSLIWNKESQIKNEYFKLTPVLLDNKDFMQLTLTNKFIMNLDIKLPENNEIILALAQRKTFLYYYLILIVINKDTNNYEYIELLHPTWRDIKGFKNIMKNN